MTENIRIQRPGIHVCVCSNRFVLCPYFTDTVGTTLRYRRSGVATLLQVLIDPPYHQTRLRVKQFTKGDCVSQDRKVVEERVFWDTIPRLKVFFCHKTFTAFSNVESDLRTDVDPAQK